MKRITITLALLFTASLASVGQAQERGKAKVPDKKRIEIPREHRPPPGMCRIWLDSVPPGQQPAPTDCATAVRNRPEKGHVIFGDDYVLPVKDRKSLPVKSFMDNLKSNVKLDSNLRKPGDTVGKSRKPVIKKPVIKPKKPIKPIRP